MAALIAVGIVGGVQAVRAGVRAHKDHKLGITAEVQVDERGRVKKAHPVYRWVSKMEAKRKNKGEGSSSSTAARPQETREERVMREKDPQMYSRPAPDMDAPPTYSDAVPAYEPPAAGFGVAPDAVPMPDFPTVPSFHPSASSEKILQALKEIGAEGELEGLVDLMILGSHGTPPQIDIKQLYDGDLDPAADDEKEPIGGDTSSLSLEQLKKKRTATAKDAARLAQQLNKILRDMQSAYLGVNSDAQTELHEKLQEEVDKLEQRLNRIIQFDARLAEMGSPAVEQQPRQRTPLLA